MTNSPCHPAGHLRSPLLPAAALSGVHASTHRPHVRHRCQGCGEAPKTKHKGQAAGAKRDKTGFGSHPGAQWLRDGETRPSYTAPCQHRGGKQSPASCCPGKAMEEPWRFGSLGVYAVKPSPARSTTVCPGSDRRLPGHQIPAQPRGMGKDPSASQGNGEGSQLSPEGRGRIPAQPRGMAAQGSHPAVAITGLPAPAKTQPQTEPQNVPKLQQVLGTPSPLYRQAPSPGAPMSGGARDIAMPGCPTASCGCARGMGQRGPGPGSTEAVS